MLVATASFLGGYLLKITPWLDEDVQTLLPSSQMDSAAIKRYAEVLGYIENRAMFSTPMENSQDIVASSLKAYLSQKDIYSDFLSPEEFVEFKAAGRGDRGGIGLDIQKQLDGSVICYPIPNGPAAASGIKPGNKLLAVDGISIKGKSLPTIVALAAGHAGTKVVIEFTSNSGTNRRVTITRSPQAAPAVSEYTFRSARIIKLQYFTPNTMRELGYLLANWSERTPIIIDLRDCGGGDFHAAVDSAMLFLMPGDPIVSVNSRSGIESYTSTLRRQPIVQPVFLWQDELTASAAEIFIAALTENERATSVGKTTAGKGTRQDIIELQNGAALILTTGYLITPRNVQFDGQGLLPMQRVEADSSDTGAFLKKTSP